ncbi:phage tail assembly chaperone [Aurantiacibacter aquimixticola]|uniref:Phage tail assembly chaperone n=1 Tax=Aurantiacibacter aquimixticola TaxID=1958945 RepID=A0A419RV71_9SPHN|nr:phage tail assembly chaperone [Aurantiacibacter aquimixticola]RJY09687.1 phage tail assembly chaperone [Aurantiacibacter aquimixticola]
MEATFAAGARRLAGGAGRLLGWPPHWFWQATPAELAAILDPESEPRGDGIDRAALQRMMEMDDNGR